MFSIYKKEIAGYFNSLIGYITVGLFLGITGLVLWVFPETSIIETGYASLDGFFSLAPYLLLFLIPAITMRSIAGERADGTFDLLLSRPVTRQQIVLGKYFGSITIALLAILPTIVYAVSLYILAFPEGNIDLGGIIGSYIGLFLLACSFVSLSLFCSCLSNNPIVAFLLSVFFCFVAFYGFGAVSQLPTFRAYQDILHALALEEHYESVSRGVLTPRDCIFFISFSVLFLTFTIGHLYKRFRPRKKTLAIYLTTLIVLCIINQSFFSSFFPRIDLTADKRFTLHKTSKEIIQKLEQEIVITIFLDGDLPSGFKRLRQAAVDMAVDLKSYSGGLIKINLINPLEGDEKQQQEYTQALINRGLFPTNLSVKSENGLSQKIIFPAAIINTDKQEINVNLLQNKTGETPEQILNNSIQNLEYAFISAIRKVTTDSAPFIGFTEGHGEPSDLELYDAMHTLMSGYQVGRVNLDSIDFTGLQRVKIIVIAKPTVAFSESDKYKLDYFIRQGGNVIWAIDQIDASLGNLQKNGSQPVIGRALNLDDQLFLYGARINYNIVADLNCGQIPLSVGNIGNQSQIELAPWYFHPILMPVSENPIVKNLDGVYTQFISTIDTIASFGIKKEILLKSSPFTRLFTTSSSISLQMVEQQPNPTEFKTQPEPVAVMLSGKFTSVFENRPVPNSIIQHKNPPLATVKESKMCIIGDGDWLINQVNYKDQSPYPLGWDRYTESQFANKQLLENMVDYMANGEGLIELRSREIKLRLLDKAKLKTEKTKWQVLNVAAPLVLLLAIALIQHSFRKRKYNKKVPK